MLAVSDAACRCGAQSPPPAPQQPPSPAAQQPAGRAAIAVREPRRRAPAVARFVGNRSARVRRASAGDRCWARRSRCGRDRRGTPKRSSQVVQTQIILAIIGALVMIVVGTSLARAFGVVGAAGLVRYRAKIDDPKDAGVMLTTLAVGLACGIGVYGLAVFATVFLMAVLWVIESFEPSARKEFILEIKAKEAAQAAAEDRSAAAPPPRQIRASRVEARGVLLFRRDADGAEDRRHLGRNHRARPGPGHRRGVENRKEEGGLRSAWS